MEQRGYLLQLLWTPSLLHLDEYSFLLVFSLCSNRSMASGLSILKRHKGKNRDLVSPHYCCCLVAQLCPTLCNPRDCSLLGSSVHGIFPGKTTGVGCHFLLQRIRSNNILAFISITTLWRRGRFWDGLMGSKATLGVLTYTPSQQIIPTPECESESVTHFSCIQLLWPHGL